MSRIGRLTGGDCWGSPKDAMIEAGMPPDEPHHGPGVYFIVEFPDLVKIGHASDVRRRLAQLQTGNPAYLHLAHAIYEPDTDRRRAIEADLQRRFRHLHARGEWFHWTDELYEYINTLCNEECYL
ncbi:GIY-YIG nuclease family protein [Micromonospora sp. NBC_00858]|uniref:GIY-YIG nuclease family protein n=1 Tax=Micromonospora sp. NBC_00858 TaxID=2975979 RepID=UPI00386B2FA1|nr:GIY-YIG nuclease family protein [Micromonospora sp. NBC_00858]